MKAPRRQLLAAVIGGVLAAAAALPADAADRKTELLAAEAQRYKAMTERDLAALDKLLADELVYVHSSSTRQSKAEHLSDIKAGRANYVKIDVKEQTPYLYGDVGVIQGVAEFTSGRGQTTTSSLRYTDVYVKRDGRWQMVAFHCTRIPAAGSVLPPPPPPAP